MSGGWAALAALVPAPSGGGGLDAALDSPLGVLLRPLGDTPQEPRWHGEGDVLTHTRLVLEALEAAPEFWALDVERRAALWLAALLHDVAGLGPRRTMVRPARVSCAPCSGGSTAWPGKRAGAGCGSSSARSYAITPRPRTSLRPRTLSGGSCASRPRASSCRFSACAC